MAAIITIQSGATWQEVATDRQKHRDATLAIIEPSLTETLPDIALNTIPVAKAFLNAEEIQITESAVEDLVVRLAKGELSTVKIVTAFLRRAVLAQKATNCVTEFLSPQALERAKYLDEYLAKNGKPIGPLHGIPISVKEHVGMKDLDHNAGFVGWVGALAPANAHILQILWKPEQFSINLYGVTTNPFNTTLTPGGSSGGEGALVGFKGSCLGIGTDIGGSIRSPAGNCGVYGMKPTSGRLPMGGLKACGAGEEQIVPTIGPLSTSLEGCKLFIKTIIDSKPWYQEPSLLPFPWKEEDFFRSKKLKIAVLWDDGVVKPQPPVTRALKQVVEQLKAKSNVEVVEWKPYKHDLAWEIIANLYFCDGGAEQSAAIASSNEPWLPLSDHIVKSKYVESHSIASLYQATIRREIYRMEYANLWNSTATSVGPNDEPEGMVDVILSPVGPGCAPKIGTAKWWGYTSQWNLLDYPGLVFPVDKVDVSKDVTKETHTPRNELDKENWDLWEQYGAEGYKDAPLSLQLVRRRYEDEKVVQALEIIRQETGLPFVNYT